ncbi:MAG: hypothetical protein IV100_11660 [Myxococcales bacterium]|nr:hypothetical protein [Myxococcales bacterium]
MAVHRGLRETCFDTGSSPLLPCWSNLEWTHRLCTYRDARLTKSVDFKEAIKQELAVIRLSTI